MIKPRRTREPEPVVRKAIRCAIYTRKSTEEGLDQDFNSLDAQRESAEAYIRSQAHEGWKLVPTRYDDGGFSGGNLERPALGALLDDIKAGKVDCVVVYKVDRLSRSLMDFSRLVEVFEEHGVSFVSVTQQFNTTHSMGRLTLNILLSFAQFEREIIGERIRDKLAAHKRLPIRRQVDRGQAGARLRRRPQRTHESQGPEARGERRRGRAGARDLRPHARRSAAPSTPASRLPKVIEEGLDQDFNSLDAQRESAEAFIRSQAHEGWRLVTTRYEDGWFSAPPRPRSREIALAKRIRVDTLRE
jgi:DNA invertase Pin-like site-specific DNA recombinase